ncbi:MAG TPA: phospholipase, partial [Candidatus Limnocylindria bacterium]|nr:phospholipase [Candidatus Limnocylindria bacterium]
MIDAIRGLLPPLLGVLDLLFWVQRHLHPPVAAELAAELEPRIATVAAPLATFEAAACPDEMRLMRDRLAEAAKETVELMTAFVDAVRTGGEIIDLYRALRRLARVQEGLYPLAPAFDAISRFFLEPSARADDERLGRLREGSLRDGEPRVGVLHASNDRKERGGFSLYAPESSDGATPMPLIVALHGGSGHGRDFLWTWVREARTRGMLVLSPTARDRTWSIMGRDDIDAPALLEMFGFVTERYPVDRARVLLTGMSDGGTYALLC